MLGQHRQGTESPNYVLPLSLFLAPPPQSVPRKLLLCPKPVQLEGWERKTHLSDPPKGLPEIGVEKQALRRGPHNGASGNSHLLYVIKWPTAWKEG